MSSYLNFDSDAFFNDTLKELDSMNSKDTYESDPDDWFPGVDKSGNGLAVIRLLPPLENERIPMVKWISHNFKNLANDRWYIENSLKSLDPKNPDPVAEYNKKLWNSTTDDESPQRKQARRQKQNLNFRVNVYVISDSSNPENNGKIKKWRFGKTFFNIIDLAMKPPQIEGAIEQEKPLNPFDLIRGADLKIQIFTEKRGGENRRNYSKSAFREERGPLFKDKKQLEELYKLYQSEPQRWSLAKYVAPDQFKDYDSLLKRLNYVMEIDTKTGKPLEVDNRQSTPKEQRTSKPQSTSTSSNDEFENLLKQDEEDEIPF